MAKKAITVFPVVVSILIWLYRSHWLEDSSIESTQIVTTPWSLSTLDNNNNNNISSAGVSWEHHSGQFDPRDFPIAVLSYLAKGGDGSIPINSWNDLLNVSAKPEIGQYWLERHPIEQLMTLNSYDSRLYPVEYNTGESVLSSIPERIDSLQELINATLGNSRGVVHHQSMELSREDFMLDSTPMEDVHYRYFKEGILVKKRGLAHYEARFYECKLTPIARVSTLHRIVRAWSRFTAAYGLKTWIAHGSLLGYYFNGLIFPWDDDLDVQVTAKSFMELVKLNNTLVLDFTDVDAIGTYVIDINPWFANRVKDSDNKIDARFIDTQTGLYIDITTLTTDSQLPSDLEDGETQELYKVFNPYHEPDAITELEVYESEMAHKVNLSITNNSLISCKDNHFYTWSELSPLIPTVFEGTIVYIPNNVEPVLLREYGRRSLYLHDFKGFHFDRHQRTWSHPTILSEYNGIMENFIENHYQVLQTTFKKHTFHEGLLRQYPIFRTGSNEDHQQICT